MLQTITSYLILWLQCIVALILNLGEAANYFYEFLDQGSLYLPVTFDLMNLAAYIACD